ncbi:MAG: 50S ribosomal protein L3 [Chloroflexi bacterium]|nr:50S ribosomal protein L3 [Chloroflexota bacterium]GIW12447.1 MAG: 50S ribosomal protein L3 [Dehalococcoidia bacterium]
MADVDGILGRKLGMSQMFRPDGRVVPVTAIEAGPCTVTQLKTQEKDGYSAVQVGFGYKKKLNRPLRGHLRKSGAANLRYLREFRLSADPTIALGARIDVGIFKPGDHVDIVGVSKGKGFAGVVKRHGFGGGPKTHGQSDRHRAPGSIGSGTTPGRVLRGLRMAGHMGHERVTVQNLEVVEADPQRNLLLVKGSVPGPANGLLIIRRARKSTV